VYVNERRERGRERKSKIGKDRRVWGSEGLEMDQSKSTVTGAEGKGPSKKPRAELRVIIDLR
jgi:hypothetical protein